MRKKGFTLIELLAVIVILAIIIVIAVPKILDVIENSRRNAAKSSALGFIEAIEYNNSLSKVDTRYIKIEDGTYESLSDFNRIKVKGDKPTDVAVKITNEKVEEANLCVSNYIVLYRDRKVSSVIKDCNSGKILAAELEYTPSDSDFKVNNVQDALDKIAKLIK